MLHDGRSVATWRTRTQGASTVVEVTPWAGTGCPAEDAFTGPVAALATALRLDIGDVRLVADQPL